MKLEIEGDPVIAIKSRSVSDSGRKDDLKVWEIAGSHPLTPFLIFSLSLPFLSMN
jgi:hypothetical protein